MSSEDLDIVVRLKGAKGAAADAKHLRAEVVGIGHASEKSSRSTRRMAKATDETGKSARRANRGFVYARKGIGGLHAGVTGLTGALGFGAGLGLIGAFKVMYDEGRGAQIEQRRLTAVLKSTHGAANVTSKQVNAYADSLSNMSGIDNDVIKSGSNLLLTFTQVQNRVGKGNKIFKRANAEMVDFAARFTHGDMQQAAKMLGRALNDPVRGVTALSRAGVSFTDQEQKQIKSLTEHNHLLKAQKEILNKVLPQIKGQAAASTNPVQKLHTALLNVAEAAGTKLLPYIDKAAAAIQKFGMQVIRGTGAGGRFRAKVEQIWKAAKPVVLWFGRAAKNVFNFVAAHPDLVKIAASLALASKAMRLMRFSSALTGAKLLFGWFRRIIALRTGETVAKGLAISLGPGPMGELGKTAGASLGGSLGAIAGATAVAAVIAGFIDAGTSHGIKNAINEGLGKQGLRLGPNGIERIPHVNTPTHSDPNANRHPLGAHAGPTARGNPTLPRGWTTPTPRHRVLVPQTPAMAADGMVGDYIHHTVVQLDSQVLWEANERVGRKKRNRR